MIIESRRKRGTNVTTVCRVNLAFKYDRRSSAELPLSRTRPKRSGIEKASSPSRFRVGVLDSLTGNTDSPLL